MSLSDTDLATRELLAGRPLIVPSPHAPEADRTIRALEVMDANDIAVGVISLAQPGVQFGDPRRATALARRCNGYASELCARWPSRL